MNRRVVVLALISALLPATASPAAASTSLSCTKSASGMGTLEASATVDIEQSETHNSRARVTKATLELDDPEVTVWFVNGERAYLDAWVMTTDGKRTLFCQDKVSL